MRIVGYVRLSRDEDKENYSSIVAQQDIIKRYAVEKNWHIDKIYIDDNYSGYTFDRPAFNEMITGLKEGNIDLVIAKDLSRIGRKNGRVLVLLDEIRESGKNVILVNEGNGGFNLREDNDDILGIKTWYNEMYVKDISRKIKANMSIKQKNGELIMGNYYGYSKVIENNKMQLVIDENVRPAIELIFRSYIDGKGYMKICQLLEDKGYLTPSQYIREKQMKQGKAFKNTVSGFWQNFMIKRILENEIYIGTLITHKRHNDKIIKGKQINVAKEEQYVFENHHEAIISKNDFELVKEISINRKKMNYRGKSKEHNYIFTGFIVCNDCGYNGTGKNISKRPKVQYGYDCSMYTRYGNKICHSHKISEAKLLFMFKELLMDTKEQFNDYLTNINFKEKKKSINNSIDDYNKNLEILNNELKVLINQKVKDILKEKEYELRKIVEDNYTELIDNKKNEINNLGKKIEELKKVNSKNIEKRLKSNIEIFDNIINSEIPNRKDIEMVLSKIILQEKDNVDIKLKVNINEII